MTHTGAPIAPCPKGSGAGDATGEALRRAILERAASDGFDVARIAPAAATPETGQRLMDWLDAGHHGDMEWMRDTADRRVSPQAMWPEARSAIVLGVNYAPDHNPLDDLAARSHGVISAYARSRDYHDVIKGRLKQLAGFIASRAQADVKVFVDTAPLMEKPLAQLSGLGWQGKHTVLVSQEFGSWLFLGIILTTAEIAADSPGRQRCGSCRACVDVCPTDAFPTPFQLDSRRCLAYLTIEHAGPIPHAFRKPMGNRVFGCDDCLAVCPWNKFAKTSRDARLAARADMDKPPLAELLALDDAAFRSRFAGTPVKRTGRARFMRNVLIAAGNSGDDALLAPARSLLTDEAPLARGAAVWAVAQLGGADALREHAMLRKHETDEHARAEWRTALATPGARD